MDALDQAIGEILLTIEDAGIEEDTIILFSSDNGGATYGGGGADNFLFEGAREIHSKEVSELSQH